MKFTWRRQALRPKYRFQTAQGGIDEKETIVVSLEHDGVVGLGEGVASRLYGQSLESTETALAGMRDMLGDDPFAIEPILARVIPRHDAQRAAIAALDSALHDWVGKRLNVPVWRLLGLSAPRVQTVFTIGIADADETRRKVDEALADGYSALKVKVGVDGDLRTLEYIRKQFNGPLLLDANEAWTVEDALRRVPDLAAFRPTMVEQPLRKDDWRNFGRIRDLGVAPIFADESCERPADVIKLNGLVDGVNVKFTKCGGLREALKMLTLARGLGLRAMLGCFVSSSLAIAPGVAIGGLFDFADLDGALLLGENDTFAGIRAERGGVLSLAGGPGLGVRLR
ncbi:MAG: dipeptide epimerase [Planctomycetes bacterium]|nr:dipeptide epimerase [Planctomycetota bacterium]